MRLGYVILHVPDVAEAVASYERAFGLTRRFVHDGGQYAEMESGGTALAFASEVLTEMNGLPPRPGDPRTLPFGAGIAFVTNGVEAAFRRAFDAGASAVAEPTARLGARRSAPCATSTASRSNSAPRSAAGEPVWTRLYTAPCC